MFTDEELNEIGWALEDGGFTHSEIDEWFEHAGIKGMKWGVRRQRRASAFERAAVPGGPKLAKVNVGLGKIGPTDWHKGGRTVTGAAARKSQRLNERQKRVDAGKMTTRDIIARYGATHVSDLIPVREKNIKKPVSKHRDAAAIAFTGARIAQSLLSGGALG